MKRITSCTISPFETNVTLENLFNDPPTVAVQYDDGTSEVLFTFYPDEIIFKESEFIGLTRKAAHALRHTKDLAYLRS